MNEKDTVPVIVIIVRGGVADSLLVRGIAEVILVDYDNIKFDRDDGLSAIEELEALRGVHEQSVIDGIIAEIHGRCPEEDEEEDE